MENSTSSDSSLRAEHRMVLAVRSEAIPFANGEIASSPTPLLAMTGETKNGRGKLRLSKWLGLYTLLPLMVVLMVIDDDADMSQTWHLILLAGIAVAVCALALSWIDRHPRLVERGGAGLTDSGDGASAMRVVRRLHVAGEGECQFAPIRHNEMDD